MAGVPFALVFLLVFIIPPLFLTKLSAFGITDDYSIIPDLIFDNYIYIFEGCFSINEEQCMTFKTYLSTLYFCIITFGHFFLGTLSFFWLFMSSTQVQIALFNNLHDPFRTSNVIRMCLGLHCSWQSLVNMP